MSENVKKMELEVRVVMSENVKKMELTEEVREEDSAYLFEEIEIEELAVDGICGVY